MKIFSFIALLAVFTFSASSHANLPIGVQVFGESDSEQASISGANLMFIERDHNRPMTAYFGVGFKSVEGVSSRIDGNYGHFILGFSKPWIISPYLEVGLDALDILAESLDEDEEFGHSHDNRSRGINGYLGMGARFSLNPRVSVDFGMKIHHFAKTDYVFDHDNPHTQQFRGHNDGTNIDTASLSINLAF